MREINNLIIHCSATPEGRDFTVEDIDRCHRQRGFRCIGYHYVIYRDGSIHPGRPVAREGAHCLGHNADSIGICYIGGVDAAGKPKDTRTLPQKKALTLLVSDLCRQYNIPRINVYGHNEFAAKSCPCFDVKKEFRQ